MCSLRRHRHFRIGMTDPEHPQVWLLPSKSRLVLLQAQLLLLYMALLLLCAIHSSP